MNRTGRILLLGTAGALAALPVTANARPAPERFALGINSVGDTCTAARVWTGTAGAVRLASDQPFAIACRGVAAAQAQGYVSALGSAPEVTQCGDALTVTVPQIGAVEVRRCSDAKLGRTAVDMRFTRGGRTIQGAALETSVGVLETALRVIVAGGGIPSERAVAKPSVDFAKLPAGPLVTTTGSGGGLTAEAALTDGVASLQAGRMLDASRILNDALRQFAGVGPATRVDLRLAAGLADSNLSQFSSADGHFSVAEQILSDSRDLPDAAARRQQLAVYRGLDFINQRRWTDAVTALTATGAANGDLTDAVVLSRLNQESASSVDTLQSSLSDTGALQRSLLEAQRNWALSVAYLAQGQLANAEAALSRSAASAHDPVLEIDPERIVWMRASIERQKGRIEVRKGEIEPALASFDCAVSALQGTAPQTPAACVLPAGPALPDTAANAPLLVETQLERASTASRDPARSPAEVLQSYSAAVQSLPDLGGTGTVSLAALERYFGLLTQTPPTPARDEEYFRAMQAIGEPAIAREYAQLQSVLSANAEVAGLLRRRVDLERQLIRLRYEISATTPGAADLSALEAERAQADGQLNDVNDKLLKANGIGALEDQPATVASIRDALRSGEVYLKLVALNTAMFGIVIAKDRTEIYRVKGSLADIEQRGRAVLTSARSDEQGVIHPFDVAGAAQLYAAITGPATDLLASASRIVYNPAGGLRQVPLAILVADPASADAYGRQPIKGDYSKVGFVGKRAESAMALSPRAFLRSRNDLKPSDAPNTFIGFGQNAPPQPAPNEAAAEQRMPFDCPLSYSLWAGAVGGRPPISAREIGIAAQALGVPGAPEVTGEAFTDANLVTGAVSRTLNQYQVLHFATHGLPETSIRVDRCVMHVPASLVTTLIAPSADGQIQSDGLLSFDEVARLQLNANLVVLSACETSGGASEAARLRGLEQATPALDGLVRSFIAANARAVLATFWRVPATQDSDELMAAFYGSGRVEPMARALRTAQMLLMNRPGIGSHPYFWGAYFLVGDGEKTMLSPARTAAR